MWGTVGGILNRKFVCDVLLSVGGVVKRWFFVVCGDSWWNCENVMCVLCGGDLVNCEDDVCL